MKKKGQVTIFVILAIIVVVGVIVFFAFSGNKEESTSENVPVFASPIKVFIDSCVEGVSEDVVYEVGLGGGYLFPPEMSNADGITYLYYDGKNYFPTISTIENEIENGISSGLIFCVDGFENFGNYDINYTTPLVNVEIDNDIVYVDVDYYVSVGQGDSDYIFRNFGTEVEVRLGLIYDLLKTFMGRGYYSYGDICIDCVLEDMFVNNLTMEIYNDYEEDVFFIVDDTIEREFRFNFVNKKN